MLSRVFTWPKECARTMSFVLLHVGCFYFGVCLHVHWDKSRFDTMGSHFLPQNMSKNGHISKVVPLERKRHKPETVAKFISQNRDLAERIIALRQKRQTENIAPLSFQQDYIKFRHAGQQEKPPPQQTQRELPTDGGIRGEVLERPIAIGKYPVLGVDSTFWKAEITALAEREGMGDYLFFGVTIVIGRINTGKSNLLAHIATLMSYYFQNIDVVTPTGKRDHTWPSVKFQVSDYCNFTIHEDMPYDLLEKDAHSVEIQHHTQSSVLAQGGTYDQGTSRERDKYIRYREYTHPVFDPNGIPYTTVPRYHPNDILKKSAIDKGKYSTIALSEEDIRKIPTSDLNIRGISLLHELNPVASLRQVLNNERLKLTPQHELAFTEATYHSRLIIIDDPASILKSSKRTINWVMALRHARQQLIIAAQRFVLVPLAIRTQVATLIVYGIDNGKEYQRLKDEYSQRIPNFDEIYAFCTRPSEESPNPFMCIRFLATGVLVTRNFTHKVDVAALKKVEQG